MNADPNSILNFFKTAVQLRRSSPAILFGHYKAIGNDPNIFAYRRTGGGQETIVALNMSDKARTAELDTKTRLKVLLSSIPFPESKVSGTCIQLAPYAAVILEVSRL